MTYDLPIVTDVHESSQVDSCSHLQLKS